MARTVSINGRNWVVGLTWVSFEDTPNKDELKEDAERLKSDWYSIRIGESVSQAGFCHPLTQKKPQKLYSLAAMLADSKEQPWLGTFKLADGLWWYIAVRDGHAILPDGDVIGGEEEILAARDRHSGYTDWKYIEGDIKLLSELVADIREKPSPVKSLTASSWSKYMVASLVAIALLVSAGGYLWWQHQKDIEERERAAAMARLRAEMNDHKAHVVLSSPLLTTPEPNVWLAACANIIYKLPFSVFGWGMKEVSCDQAAVTVNWEILDGATVSNRPAGKPSADGKNIVQNIALPDLDKKGADNSRNLQEAMLIMRGWAQGINLSLNLTQVMPAPVLSGTAPKDIPPPPPPTASVRIQETQVSPFTLDFSSIPGLRLTMIKNNSAGWTVTGVIYGRQ